MSISVGATDEMTHHLIAALTKAVSIGLQSGVPFAAYARAYVGGAEFGPNGPVVGSSISSARSVVDWAFRVLMVEYFGMPDPAPYGPVR